MLTLALLGQLHFPWQSSFRTEHLVTETIMVQNTFTIQVLCVSDVSKSFLIFSVLR